MAILVTGASGATGSLVVQQLLDREQAVIAVLRSPEKLSDDLKKNKNLRIIPSALLDMDEAELDEALKDCSGVISCLGHTLNMKGMFGAPRYLVTDSLKRICHSAVSQPREHTLKVVLMNSSGCLNPELGETISFKEKAVMSLIRTLVPPHRDNEQAVQFLREEMGANHPFIEWVGVRPDSLVDRDASSPYSLHPSPTSSAIFASRQTSRINVAHFMAELVTDLPLWQSWKGKTPVIYDGADA